MNTLLVTTKFSPLTGPSTLGDAAAQLASNLSARGDVEVAVVLPAFPGLVEAAGSGLHALEVTLPLAPPLSARIYEYRAEGLPQVFLIDAEPFRQATGLESTAPAVALTLAAAAVEIVHRLAPPIGLLHAFGWPASLATVLLAARGLACESVVTPEPGDGSSLPDLTGIKTEAARLGIVYPEQSPREIPACALVPLDELPAAPVAAQAPGTPAEAPVVCLSGLSTELMLGVARRLLAGPGSVLAFDPAMTPSLRALALNFPGRIHFLNSGDEAAFDLLVTGDSHEPDSALLAARAAEDAKLIVRPAPAGGSLSFPYYRSEERAIWTALMRALGAFEESNTPGVSAPGTAEPERDVFVDRCHETYRQCVTAALAAAPL